MVVSMQIKMGEQLEAKVRVWKTCIKDNRGSLLLCNEVARKQNIPPSGESNDAMDYEMEVDLSENSLKQYDYFTPETYAKMQKLINDAKEKRGDALPSNTSLPEVLTNLETAILPFYK